ncbi:uncharacterized protein G2W53_026575 [Senna tora]|uniref:Uncharacterized protein n=1 Tax=Senna tora TaxID=362788 RepID=A0A834WF77_9FABA|nr:uncharacterized protein G2W53_026575 [Senna tora]
MGKRGTVTGVKWAKPYGCARSNL